MGSVWPAVKMDTLESIVTTVRKGYTFSFFSFGTKICKTYIYENISFKRANKATLVKTVPPFAHHIVRHVDTQTDIVVVPLVIQDTDVPQVYLLIFTIFLNMFRDVIVLI